MDDNNLKAALADDQQDDPSASGGPYYADDLNAQAVADGNLAEDEFEPQGEQPVTTGGITLGDMDNNPEEGQGSADSYDEENDGADLIGTEE